MIPKDYKKSLQSDKQNGNSKWYDITMPEMDQIIEYMVFQDHMKAKIDPKSIKVSNAPEGLQIIRVHLILTVKMMADTWLDRFLEDISLHIPLTASTLELSPSDP